jgi:hypothetical protein
MDHKKLLLQMFGWMLVLQLLAACGAPQPTPTPIPPTPTPVPPTATPVPLPSTATPVPPTPTPVPPTATSGPTSAPVVTRTYYETLDLSTPESAIQTFVEAFQRGDFESVFLIFAPFTQFSVQEDFKQLKYSHVMQVEQVKEIYSDVPRLGHGEHAIEGIYLFDQLILSAKRHSSLLIDLKGEISFIGTEGSETESGDVAIDVTTNLECITEPIVFRMVQAPSGRWRVLQVIVAGGDEAAIPFAVPSTVAYNPACPPELTPEVAQGPRTYYETLDLATPESAVQAFSEAFQREDFETVYLILAPSTQFVLQQHLHLLDFGCLVQIAHWDEIKADLSQVVDEYEHAREDLRYGFDRLMLAAKRHSAFLIDLSGGITIIGTEASETTRGDAAIDVITNVQGLEALVVFRMVQAPSGRWRVFQVIVPGGDEEVVPWAVPTTDE